MNKPAACSLRHFMYLAAALLSLLLCGNAAALSVTQTTHALLEEAQYLEDPTGTLTLAEIRQRPSQHRFVPFGESHEAPPYSAVWVKLALHFSPDAVGREFHLLARQQNLYDISIYRPDEQGRYVETVTGDNYPASTRELPDRRYGFRLQPHTEHLTVYLRYVGGTGATQFTWDLLEQAEAQKQARSGYFLNIAVMSALAALLIFNMGIATALRKPEYGWYCANHLFVMLTLLTLDGISFLYMWPETPALNARALHVFNLCACSTRLMAIMYFLDTRSVAPRLHKAGVGLIGLLLVSAACIAVVGVPAMPRFSAPLPWAVSVVYGLLVCAYAAWLRVHLAGLLFLVLLVPSITSMLQAAIIVSSEHVGPLGLQVAKLGFLLHALLYSLCLAARLKRETASRKQALYDNLTGLPGTTLLRERFEVGAGLSKLEGKGLAVLFVDLDGFKAVNDELGHAAGDQLLKEVGKRLRATLRQTDTVARIGGDEFALVLPQVEDRQAAELVAAKLLGVVAQPCEVAEGTAQVSASIGIALYPDQGENLDALLAAADTAMYCSKREGKNRYWSCGQCKSDMDTAVPALV